MLRRVLPAIGRRFFVSCYDLQVDFQQRVRSARIPPASQHALAYCANRYRGTMPLGLAGVATGLRTTFIPRHLSSADCEIHLRVP